MIVSTVTRKCGLCTTTARSVLAPQVGKVVQDLLKLSDESELDILSQSMQVMVDSFQTELLPVAVQLTSRLVSIPSSPYLYALNNLTL